LEATAHQRLSNTDRGRMDHHSKAMDQGDRGRISSRDSPCTTRRNNSRMGNRAIHHQARMTTEGTEELVEEYVPEY